MLLTDIFVLVIGLFSMVTNGVLIYILLRDPLKCFKASTTYFIISLSVSDLLTGTNACFWALDDFVLLSPEFERYLLSFFWITTQVSFLTLLAMSVERFLIVKYPIYCRVWITKKRVLLAVACIWSISTTLGGLVLLPPPQRNYVQFSIFCEFFLSVFVIAGLYVFILFRIKSSQKTVRGTGQLHRGGVQALARQPSIRKTFSGKKDTYGIEIRVTEEPSLELSRTLIPVCLGSPRMSTKYNGTNNNGLGKELLNGNKFPEEKNFDRISPEGEGAKEARTQKRSVEFNEEARETGKSRREFINAAQSIIKNKEKSSSSKQDKLTAVVLLLVGILALTVLPYLLASQILLGYQIFCKCHAPEVLHKFMFYYFPIELLNFAVNPLIYAWRLPQYRRSLRHLCSKHQANMEASVGWASFRSASFRMRRDYNSA